MLTKSGPVDPDGLAAAERLLAEETCGAVDYTASTQSTNTRALADINSRQVPATMCPKLYLTDEQTSGRGRHGRSWISDGGTLTFSLVIHLRNQNSAGSKLVSLAVGVGVARCLEFEYGPIQSKLKWPNDVHFGGGKVAGILLESNFNAADQIVIGVGINVGTAPELPSGTKHETRSVTELVGRTVPRYELLEPVVTAILETLDLLKSNPQEVLDAFRSRCLLTNHHVHYFQGEVSRHGLCRGVNDGGELVVETPSGLRTLQSGEAHLVRLD